MHYTLRVGACQTPEIIGNIADAVRCIENFAERATAGGVDLLLFPECFLQGYLVEADHLQRHALDLHSADFKKILRRLATIRPVLVFGVIELLDGRFFNSAVVVTHGEITGVYRKNHLTAGEALFTPGQTYPVFKLKGITYGITICYDTQFSDGAKSLAAQGAQIMLVPAQNMMRRQNAEKWKHLHNQIRMERVKETGMWLISADVTGERGSERIAYGPTCAINPQGEVVAQIPVMTTGMITAEI